MECSSNPLNSLLFTTDKQCQLILLTKFNEFEHDSSGQNLESVLFYETRLNSTHITSH